MVYHIPILVETLNDVIASLHSHEVCKCPSVTCSIHRLVVDTASFTEVYRLEHSTNPSVHHQRFTQLYQRKLDVGTFAACHTFTVQIQFLRIKVTYWHQPSAAAHCNKSNQTLLTPACWHLQKQFSELYVVTQSTIQHITRKDT